MSVRELTTLVKIVYALRMDRIPRPTSNPLQPPSAPKKPGKAPARDFSGKARRLFEPEDPMRDLSNRLSVASIKKDSSPLLADDFFEKIKQKLGPEEFKKFTQRINSMDPQKMKSEIEKMLGE